jgi:hypothetical protein
MTSFKGCNMSQWLNGTTVFVRYKQTREFSIFSIEFQGSFLNDIKKLWLKIDPQPLLSHFVTVLPLSKLTSQTYDPTAQTKREGIVCRR